MFQFFASLFTILFIGFSLPANSSAESSPKIDPGPTTQISTILRTVGYNLDMSKADPAACPDLSGNWQGMCGGSMQSIRIVQKDCARLMFEYKSQQGAPFIMDSYTAGSVDYRSLTLQSKDGDRKTSQLGVIRSFNWIPVQESNDPIFVYLHAFFIGPSSLTTFEKQGDTLIHKYFGMFGNFSCELTPAKL